MAPNDSFDTALTLGQLRTAVDAIATELVLAQDKPSGTAGKQWASELALLAHAAFTHAAEDARLFEVSELTGTLIRTLAHGDEPSIFASITALQNALAGCNLLPTLKRIDNEVRNSAASASLSSDPELVSEFILESRDHLSSIENQLVATESDASNGETLNAIFRSFHTIKGLAGFLEFSDIQAVSHEVETLLDLARNGQLSISGQVVDIILESADHLKAQLDQIEADLHGRPRLQVRDGSELVQRLQALIKVTVAPAPGPAVEAEDTVPDAFAIFDVVATDATEAEETTSSATSAAKNGVEAADDPLAIDAAAPALERRSHQREASQFLKVDAAKLDALVNMIGELVISQSMLKHDENLAAITNPRLQRNLSQLSRITLDIQKSALSMRMVPIGQLFQRSGRIVRDLTRKTGKKIELTMSGEDTELDRTLIDELADPLMHMIRNAADHGIESPDQREMAGKRPEGHISLSAHHQAGHIIIRLSDDGRGLNREKIIQKAHQRSLIAEAAELSDSEVYNLIFEPGFSTAEKITDLSGRGVGMDVVKRQVQKLRGRIEIHSSPGAGTVFEIKLPLTLAIIDGLIVAVGSERYVVPIYAVREMFRPDPSKLFTVEGRAELLMVRGSLLPIIRLHRLFGISPQSEAINDGLVIVAESGAHRFCLLVDGMLGKQEVVIKSLGGSFVRASGVVGGAILGDGRVGLILDLDAIYGDRTYDSRRH